MIGGERKPVSDRKQLMYREICCLGRGRYVVPKIDPDKASIKPKNFHEETRDRLQHERVGSLGNPRLQRTYHTFSKIPLVREVRPTLAVAELGRKRSMEKASLDAGDDESLLKSSKKEVEKEKPENDEDDDELLCGWNQSDSRVIIKVEIGAGLENKDIEATILANSCKLKLKDGRTWSCSLYAYIEPDSSSGQYEGSSFTFCLEKGAEEEWPQLEEDEAAKNLYVINHVKHNFYEKQTDMMVNMYVKCIDPASLIVEFEQQSFHVLFSTKDSKFLALHPRANSDTVFSWTVKLRDQIYPEECKWKITNSMIEIQLKKKDGRHWPALEAATHSATAGPSNTWVPLSGPTFPSSATASATASSNAAIPLPDVEDSNKVGERLNTTKKPTCTVAPLSKAQKATEQVVTPGFTGLDNLGNTCFMNSVLQALANTREFRDYFLETKFSSEINTENPLGTGGNLAMAFAVLIRILWSGQKKSCAPAKLKTLVSIKASQFTGFAQHDAQEFMAFLLDGLHEDLNRVKEKPYIANVDTDGLSDEEAAELSWKQYKRRNDSFVVDLFQGQYKSKLVCPACDKVSITFDPFLYLSVPLPKKKRTVHVYYFSKDPYTKPKRLLLRLAHDAIVDELMDAVYLKVGTHPHCQRVFEVYKGKVHKFFERGSSLSEVTASDTIFVFEVLSERLVGESVYEVIVTQRMLQPNKLSRCSYCKSDYPNADQLRRCSKCYRASYCDKQCQRNHWPTHQVNCKEVPEPVGCPFIISIPHSRATFSLLGQYMEAYAQHSVDVFQPPVNLMQTEAEDLQETGQEGSQETGQEVRLPKSDVGDGHEASSAAGAPTAPAGTSGEEKSPVLGGSGDIVQSGDLDLSVKEAEDKEEKDVCSPQVTPAKEKVQTTGTAPCSLTPGGKDENQQAPKTRIVIGQQRDVTDRPEPYFFIRPQLGQNLSGPELQRLTDKGPEPLDLTGRNRCLHMDWRNKDKSKNYVMVQSKDLDVDKLGSDHDIPTEGGITLDHCLQLFTEPERLSPEEAWYCPVCKKHQEATKQMSLWRLPAVLIVQLKRFSFRNLIWRDKIDKLVEYPLRNLDLNEHCVDRVHPESEPPPLYDLYAVVNHHGGILGGHYTTYARLADPLDCRKTDKEWRLFDDSHVGAMPERNVVSRSAYLLFYRRRGATVSLPRAIIPSDVTDKSKLEQSYAAEEEEEEEEETEESPTTGIDLGIFPSAYPPVLSTPSADDEKAPTWCDFPFGDCDREKLSYTDMDTVD